MVGSRFHSLSFLLSSSRLLSPIYYAPTVFTPIDCTPNAYATNDYTPNDYASSDHTPTDHTPSDYTANNCTPPLGLQNPCDFIDNYRHLGAIGGSTLSPGKVPLKFSYQRLAPRIHAILSIITDI